MTKPGIPQGTRDFSAEEVRKRRYIFDTLRAIFELYNYSPLETPAMENLVTLTGKYGEEGDRLIFKILNNGLHEQKDEKKAATSEEWKKILDRAYSSPAVTERALRYDLTIPFARYVVMHQNELSFPFRRYQMQPVWRADRPQKGRYREFWQCDCDVVGSTSLLNEAELLCIYREAFHRLRLPVTLKVNSRKILAGIAEYCGAPELLIPITIAIDKLDKQGIDKVTQELAERGLTPEQATTVTELIGSSDLEQMRAVFTEKNIAVGLKGIEELEQALRYHAELARTGWNASSVAIDFTLARGLNYYTGLIVEVVCAQEGVKMGSIGGGGRYDDLTGLFGLKNLSGVGVSFGIDRIYDVLEELGLFPEQALDAHSIMLVNFGGEEEQYALQVLSALRSAGVAAELYPDAVKFDRQMKYADKRSIAYVVIAGSEERSKGTVGLKNFRTGEQETLPVDALVERFRK